MVNHHCRLLLSADAENRRSFFLWVGLYNTNWSTVYHHRLLNKTGNGLKQDG
ncbi:hypothetical protein RDWZM_002784 [Blomia tropicalis]|uniref:Uncharacterized protein n=1 Tax=Blomia tropicalis TaxID=40697 RepID=A0A9Q0MET4_BLOTA|nr:hypothetical protein RDWZM_002784 [Blomia tropicalis]